MTKFHSLFYYGFEVTAQNLYLDFKEGSNFPIYAELTVGSYTAQSICVALKTALDAAGNLTYAVTLNRNTRRITIAADGPFTILGSTGERKQSSILPVIGFSTSVDTTEASSHTGTQPAGFAFAPQFYLQDYVAPEHYQQAVDASVSKTASGLVEVVKFGTEKFMQCNIMLQNSIQQEDNPLLRTDLLGVENLAAFMQFLVTKAPLEFMPNENAKDVYMSLLLESTPESQDGVGYKLKEMYDRGLNGYFQTGTLKFRILEDFT